MPKHETYRSVPGTLRAGPYFAGKDPHYWVLAFYSTLCTRCRATPDAILRGGLGTRRQAGTAGADVMAIGAARYGLAVGLSGLF